MPCTHGKTRLEAIRNGEKALKMYVEAWQLEGETIPQPKTLLIA
jgi:predicted RNase H-like HicB family nuclease